MKKIFTAMVLIVTLLLTNFTVSAAEKIERLEESDFNLAYYLETNKVSSRQEIENAIVSKTSNKAVLDSILYSNDKQSSEESIVSDFRVDIDEKSEMIFVTEVYSTPERVITSEAEKKGTAKSGTVYGRMFTAERSAYSYLGYKCYTVRTIGDFNYDKLSYCIAVQEEGYFIPNNFSIYSSSPWIGSADLGETAYVKTYGTATAEIALAKLLGINLVWDSDVYKLQITCDKMGDEDIYWSLTH